MRSDRDSGRMASLSTIRQQSVANLGLNPVSTESGTPLVEPNRLPVRGGCFYSYPDAIQRTTSSIVSIP
jgi:hypothetical protein